MKYVLIAIIMVRAGGPPAVVNVEFDDAISCFAAEKIVRGEFEGAWKLLTLCLPKGK